MADKIVPNLDAEKGYDSEPRGFSDFEFRRLEAEATSKENLNREADQRYYLRLLAVIVAVLLILGMGVMLFHISHVIFTPSYLDIPSMYVVAVLVAPILSTTALSIGLLIAAFRGFKGSDMNDGIAMAAGTTVRGAGFMD